MHRRSANYLMGDLALDFADPDTETNLFTPFSESVIDLRLWQEQPSQPQ